MSAHTKARFTEKEPKIAVFFFFVVAVAFNLESPFRFFLWKHVFEPEPFKKKRKRPIGTPCQLPVRSTHDSFAIKSYTLSIRLTYNFQLDSVKLKRFFVKNVQLMNIIFINLQSSPNVLPKELINISSLNFIFHFINLRWMINLKSAKILIYREKITERALSSQN